jgi:hypothetical protein
MKKRNIFEEMASVRIDLGAYFNKQPGFIGVDIVPGPNVDIVQDLTMFPWKEIPDECASLVKASFVNNYINPAPANPQLAALVDLLLKKKVLTEKEVAETIGEYRFTGGFIRYMDEVWRITKPDGQFMVSHPFASSPFYEHDPAHINPITHLTYSYFDPLAKDPSSGQLYNLYLLYRPKPWKLVSVNYSKNGFVEVLLEKRRVDESYGANNKGK